MDPAMDPETVVKLARLAKLAPFMPGGKDLDLRPLIELGSRIEKARLRSLMPSSQVGDPDLLQPVGIASSGPPQESNVLPERWGMDPSRELPVGDPPGKGIHKPGSPERRSFERQLQRRVQYDRPAGPPSSARFKTTLDGSTGGRWQDPPPDPRRPDLFDAYWQPLSFKGARVREDILRALGGPFDYEEPLPPSVRILGNLGLIPGPTGPAEPEPIPRPNRWGYVDPEKPPPPMWPPPRWQRL